MDFGSGGGRTSEWNEAMLKMTRLHQIQTLINEFRMNLSGMSNQKFNYEHVANLLHVLYYEGRSKYSESERKKVDNIKDLVTRGLEARPPHKKSVSNTFGKTKELAITNHQNFNDYIKLLDIYESTVKDLNDKHGLTTSNKMDEEGWD